MLERADTEEAIGLNRSRLRSTRPVMSDGPRCFARWISEDLASLTTSDPGFTTLKELSMTNEDKAATRTGYGCLLAIAVPVAIFFAFIFIPDWGNKKAVEGASEKQVQRTEGPPVSLPDPFGSNAVVYSCWPSGNVLGEKQTAIAFSTNYDAIYDLMLQESDTKYEIAVSAGRQLLRQDYTPESEIKQTFVDYILDKQRRKQLLFMGLNVKMQIIQQKYEGDVSHRRIYECRVLEPGSEGMIVYMQSGYLTTQPPEQSQ